MRVSRWPAHAILLQALLLAGAAAQTPPASLHVEGVGEPISVDVARHQGHAAFPAWVLRGLGARVDGTASGARVVLDADTLEFFTGSPFFTARGAVWQLVEAAYQDAGIFYLPHQLFAEWLPATYPERVHYQDGRLRLRTVAAAPGTTTPAPAVRADRVGPVGRPADIPVVVIDPGHGGVDPGRIGPGGLKEKDVVLQVSRRLAQVLAQRGYEVRMTRTADTLINLHHRSRKANEWRGSRPGLFLSIHANGVTDSRVRGFETFFLSEARTEDERRVAEMENAAVAYETPDRVGGITDLDFILNNLRNDYYIRASHDLASLVQDTFAGFHRGPNRGVKQAGFRVLIGAFMPAVLIELGFMSNPTEERLLGSVRFQSDAAVAIADAVDRFFEKQGELWGASEP
jgi:N-acetylmuramoyl-L-alanine amidase